MPNSCWKPSPICNTNKCLITFIFLNYYHCLLIHVSVISRVCLSTSYLYDFVFVVFRTGAVNAASGSAYAEFGNTKVIVSVWVLCFLSQMCHFILLQSAWWGVFYQFFVCYVLCLMCSFYRFGPRESKKAMMYSDTGRLNCNVSYTTFSTPVRGQVC